MTPERELLLAVARASHFHGRDIGDDIAALIKAVEGTAEADEGATIALLRFKLSEAERHNRELNAELAQTTARYQIAVAEKCDADAALAAARRDTERLNKLAVLLYRRHQVIDQSDDWLIQWKTRTRFLPSLDSQTALRAAIDALDDVAKELDSRQ